MKQFDMDPTPKQQTRLLVWGMNYSARHGQQFIGQQAVMSLLHGPEMSHTLMLIHCVYEAGNPQLAPLLGSYLSMRGNLNHSDLLALQTIFKLEKDGKYACRLDTINLHTAMPLTDMQELARVIEACPNLQTLGLFVGFYDKMLVDRLINNSKLRKFEYCWLGLNEQFHIESCKSLSATLKHNQNLQVLDLAISNIFDFGAKELANVLNTTQLVELDLTRTQIGEEGVKELCGALENNHCLASLHLHDNMISPAALESLSRCLVKNNTLKMLGMIEEPVVTELSEENLQEFITRLCFNSSVTCVMLHGRYMHTPAVQQALTLVNCTRKLKHQPPLSIGEHYPKNYYPDVCNDFGIRACGIKMNALKSINHPVMSSHRFYVNVWSRIGSEEVLTLQKILYVEEQLPLQEQHGTLRDSLQFITSFKRIHAMCVRKLLPRATGRRQVVRINAHLLNPASQYQGVVEALQKQRPFSSPQCQLFHTVRFIHQSKALRSLHGHTFWRKVQENSYY